MVNVLSDVQSILLVNNWVSLARILVLSRNSIPLMLCFFFFLRLQRTLKKSYFQIHGEGTYFSAHVLLHWIFLFVHFSSFYSPGGWWSLHLFSGFSVSGAKNETSFHLVRVPSMNGKRHRYNSLKRKDSAWNANTASHCHLLYDSLRNPGLLFSTFHYQCFSYCLSSLYAFFTCCILLLHAFLRPL